MKKFTLIELLVVVAIIGNLASILLPSISRAREVSIQAVCMSNLKQQAMALEMYLSANNGGMPPHLTTPPPPYIPPFRPHRLATYMNGTLEDSKEVFECPKVTNHHNLGDYADNHAHVFPNKMSDTKGVFITLYSRPAELLSHVDSGEAATGRGSWWVPCPVTHSGLAVEASGRHLGKSSVLYLDSHVSSVKQTQVLANRDDLWGHFKR
ncbi:MAG: prepilin-type N-terminal cleavage/methylation domain-containing protein [Lentisphaeraceae bacterium]|nr:prepilin-type N-terminal cleavage/methylation domain-containing protein [Lentisphaeraceae bacterium]